MIDWDDYRFFLAVARHGSLSGAALDLQVAQSTVGRRLASLEASLGVRLLNRTPDGYVPTSAGLSVRQKAERLEAETQSLQRDLGGQDSRFVGHVRVMCAEAMATHILAPCLAEMHATHSDIMIELVSNPGEVSLAMREADISVKLKRSSQNDLIGRRVGTIAFGLYASEGYLELHDQPDFAAGCPGQFLVTQLDDIEDQPQIKWLTDIAPRARIAMQTGSHEAALLAAVHGGGLACLARFRADSEERLVRLVVPVPVPTVEIWLMVHRDNRDTARIRAVLDHIAANFQSRVSDLLPEDERRVNTRQDQ